MARRRRQPRKLLRRTPYPPRLSDIGAAKKTDPNILLCQPGWSDAPGIVTEGEHGPMFATLGTASPANRLCTSHPTSVTGSARLGNYSAGRSSTATQGALTVPSCQRHDLAAPLVQFESFRLSSFRTCRRRSLMARILFPPRCSEKHRKFGGNMTTARTSPEYHTSAAGHPDEATRHHHGASSSLSDLTGLAGVE